MLPASSPYLNLEALPSGNERAAEVELEGWICPFVVAAESSYFALVDAMACCAGCLPRNKERRVEVFSTTPIPITGERVRLRGRLHVLEDDPAGWRFQLREARLLGGNQAREGGFTRRSVLRGATLACMAAAGLEALALPEGLAPVTQEQARDVLKELATVDIHSHAGGVTGLDRVKNHGAFTAVADPMRDGAMAVLCLAIVSDTPTHRVMPNKRIRPFRDPAAGELYAYAQQSFERVHALAQEQRMKIIMNAADLRETRSEQPAIVVSAEGGDFLEGQVDRVDEAHSRWALRHLQLTHYRVNELGDIQTEPAEHGGLTTVGAEVIRRCNRLGIVVDVAHGTFDLVKQAAAVTTTPLVLSHTSLAGLPGPHSRLISADHARAIAGTGGVIGIWPPASLFPDMAALAAGMARMVDVVGVDHVALGTDMRGLVGPSTLKSYRDLPLLSRALLEQGFDAAEVRQILGANYVRVFGECLANPASRPGQQGDPARR